MNIAPIYLNMEELVTNHLRVAPFEVTEPPEPWKSAAVETCGHLKVSAVIQVRPTKVIPRVLEFLQQSMKRQRQCIHNHFLYIYIYIHVSSKTGEVRRN